MADNSAENSSDRIARAAGRAARAFRESQDAERIRREQARAEAPRTADADGSRATGLRERAVRAAAQAAERAEPLKERVGHAAGEAVRSFKENQAQDAARLRGVREQVRAEDDAARAERQAERERALDARDEAEAEAGRVHPLLRLTRLWWLAVSLLLLGLAAAFVYNGVRAGRAGGEVIDPVTGLQSIGPLGGATGQYTVGGVLAALALVTLWGWVGLLRRRRASLSTLTTVAVLLAIPAVLRPNPLFIVLGAAMAIGAVLLWLPPVRSRVRR